MKTVFIIFALITWASIAWLYWLLFKEKATEKPSEPVSESESNGDKEEAENPVTEPEKPQEPQVEQPKEEEPATQTPVDEPTNDPVDEEPSDETFDELMEYFLGYKNLPNLVEQYLYDVYNEGHNQYLSVLPPCVLEEEYFPTPLDYYTNNPCTDADSRLYAWLFAMVLSELMPEQRSEFYQKAYDYKFVGKEAPLYGYSFDSDPSIMIMVAAEVWAMTRDEEFIPTLRKELGSSMVSYTKDISELYIDICKFLPSAPYPYLSTYANRKEYPADAKETARTDDEIHQYISKHYTLDSKDETLRQATIQAIANKEYKKPHLFGKPRTVKDTKYGEMTFNPVFGKHNIGVEIPDDGAIANLAYEVGKVCTDSRKPLLDQEYGRCRPGQGFIDPSANEIKKERALVNYAIEEGDGHTTGYYNKGGDYVDGNGNHIGDYETFYQGQLYANSYPSGHSAFIEGVALVLTLIMPDKAGVIEEAKNEFAISRCICRYHWMSDTIIGRIVGTMMPPVLAATTNFEFDRKLSEAKKEYEAILNGDIPTPAPVEDKVNTSLSYVIGGYGSCHVDAGEGSISHRCNKEATKERHPFINVSQRVEFTIEGAGVHTIDGKTSGTWEANTNYELVCPAVAQGEEKIATITMRNDKGVRTLYYKLSWNGTHDDGIGTY